MSKDNFKPVSSKLIAGYSYNADTQVLSVNFATDPDTTWEYSPVDPPLMSQVFDSSGSAGSLFIKHIKRNGQIKAKVANNE